MADGAEISVTPCKHTSTSKDEQDEKQIRNAVLYITEGEKNDVFLQHPEDEDGVLSYYIIHNPAYYITHLISTILLMLLALVEKPAVFAIEEGGATLIHAPLEIILLLFLISDVTLRAFWLRKKVFRHRTVLIALFLAVMFVEAIAVLIRHANHIRVTRALRPLFFIDSYLMSETRRTLRNIANCLKEILDVLLVLLFMIAIFALIGYYLFAHLDRDYFSTLGQSYVSLFITLTTANHPDVMMEAYHFNGWNALFFIIFLVITLYLLTSVLLGLVYSTFTDASKHKFEKKFKHQRTALKRAFEELTYNERVLDDDTFLKLMLKYQPLMPKWKALCTFKALQEINDKRSKETQLQDPTLNIKKLTREKLTDEEFQNLYEALDFKWIPPNKKESAILFPYYWHLKLKDYLDKFSMFVDSWPFKIFFTLVVIANTVFLIVYTAWRGPSGHQPYQVMREVLWVSFLFVGVYCIEAILKIVAFRYKYFTKFWNLFDLVIIISSLVMLFLELNPGYCVLLLFRPVKLIRLLWLKKRYRNLLKALMLLKQKIISSIILLLVVYYSFAIIGMEAFCMAVKQNCCDHNHTWYDIGEYYSGTDSETTPNVYWLLNFNHVLSSLVTLFVLMVVNNWYIVMEGFAAEVQQLTSVHHAWLTRLYFMSFYIITLVILQVNVTFIVDAIANRNTWNKEKQKKREQFNSESNPDTATETKPSVVAAFYDSLKISISKEEIGKEHKPYPRRWWQYITYGIRMRRRVDFTKHQCMSDGKYTIIGERSKGKDYLNLQLYSDQISEWEKHCEENTIGCTPDESNEEIHTRGLLPNVNVNNVKKFVIGLFEFLLE